jgi:2'-hydroxyisoflavone reductase
MRLLVMGGTRFVGRAMVAEALARGHDVTLLHRGTEGEDPFPDAEHLHADRDGDLAVLAGREFDATLDVSAYLPSQVRRLAQALDGRGGHHVLVSTVSVYAPPQPGFREDSPLLPAAADDVEEVTPDSYGPLKVRAEELAHGLYGDALTIVRPSYVVGPGDYSGRFTYRVRRLAEGGEVLAPGEPTDPMQVIDARDMAAWVVGLAEGRVAGVFHAMHPAPPSTFGELLDAVAETVAPSGTHVTWAEGHWLAEEGAGEDWFPLWAGDDPGAWALAADPSAAVATGLTCRPVQDTARDVLSASAEVPIESLPGLTRDQESQLLAAWHDRRTGL